MGNLKIELNRAGVRELLQSDEMMAICEKRANDALSQLGEGYIVTKQVDDRVNASIYAETYQAKKDNSENNSIMKAVWGGKK